MTQACGGSIYQLLFSPLSRCAWPGALLLMSSWFALQYFLPQKCARYAISLMVFIFCGFCASLRLTECIPTQGLLSMGGNLLTFPEALVRREHLPLLPFLRSVFKFHVAKLPSSARLVHLFLRASLGPAINPVRVPTGRGFQLPSNATTMQHMIPGESSDVPGMARDVMKLACGVILPPCRVCDNIAMKRNRHTIAPDKRQRGAGPRSLPQRADHREDRAWSS